MFKICGCLNISTLKINLHLTAICLTNSYDKPWNKCWKWTMKCSVTCYRNGKKMWLKINVRNLSGWNIFWAILVSTKNKTVENLKCGAPCTTLILRRLPSCFTDSRRLLQQTFQHQKLGGKVSLSVNLKYL